MKNTAHRTCYSIRTTRRPTNTRLCRLPRSHAQLLQRTSPRPLPPPRRQTRMPATPPTPPAARHTSCQAPHADYALICAALPTLATQICTYRGIHALFSAFSCRTTQSTKCLHHHQCARAKASPSALCLPPCSRARVTMLLRSSSFAYTVALTHIVPQIPPAVSPLQHQHRACPRITSLFRHITATTVFSNQRAYTAAFATRIIPMPSPRDLRL